MIGSVADDPALSRFADTYSPIVILNRFFEHPNVNSIIVDNERGAFLAVEHLIVQGHRTIGMLVTSTFSRSQIRRVRGYEEALKHYGIVSDRSLIVGETSILQGGYNAMQELMRAHPEVTAVFTYNDLMGLGAMRAAYDLGKRIPEDIAVIGFDNIGLTSMVIPSLSSVHVDKYAIGQQAMNRILAMLDKPDNAFATIEVGVELITRESTG
jgi:LacI family transcriptional regulator